MTADLCVAGGGMAGVCAALAAARNGRRVVLIQDRSVLGGNASSEIRMHMVGASCSGRRPGARESGLIDEIRVEDAVRNPQRSPAMFDLLLYDLVAREPNITLLLDTDCTGCDMEGSRIVAVHAVRQMTEETFRIRAPFFADCTGDGRLGVEAGAAFRMGREAREEYGESLAPETADSRTLGSTILFTARRHDRPMPFAAPPWARRFTEEDLALRSHRELEYGYWWVEWGGELDTIRDNDRIRHELLRIALGVWDHVKNECPRGADPSAAYEKWLGGEEPKLESPENWALDWVGALPGKRESRRFLGPHVLTQDDVLAGRTFRDQVAYGGWWIDLHPPAGVDAVREYPSTQVETPHLYGIPLRCLYSRNVENLFFAGRNISATHIAFASTRVMATCAAVGQAVGSAAAVAVEHGFGGAPELLADAPLRVLQQRLLAQDAYLLDIRSEDPTWGAEIHASSETPQGPVAALGDGITRRTRAQWNPSLDEASHQWMSAALPAWVALRWPSPRPVRRIQLIFDTGFERELTLSMSDLYSSRMVRGPQPETVREYTIEAGGWRADVTGNYQRRRVHELPEGIVASSVRLTVHATHGAPEARVFEIRVN